VPEAERLQLEEVNDQLTLTLLRPLRFLNSRQIARIDRMLTDMGPFGEIRLIKRKGSLRFIERVESEDAD